MENSYHPLKSIKNCLVNISAASISEKFCVILGWRRLLGEHVLLSSMGFTGKPCARGHDAINSKCGDHVTATQQAR